jgi:hypothetical protein
MTIQQWSLVNLYNQGILPCVPMDIPPAPVTQSGLMQMSGNSAMMHPLANQVNGTQYLDNAQKGALYNTQNPDVYYSNNNLTTNPYEYRDKSFREEILDSANNVNTKTKSKTSNWVKGLISSGVIVLTLALLFRKGKKAIVNNISKFWSKLNPKNWFKK